MIGTRPRGIATRLSCTEAAYKGPSQGTTFPQLRPQRCGVGGAINFSIWSSAKMLTSCRS